MMIEPNTLMATHSLSQSGFDNAAKAAHHTKQTDQFDIVAQEFEAMYIAEMMKPMFEGLQVDPMFGGGKGEEVFRGMLLQEYGKVMTQSGGIGIADAVKRQMIEMQEVADTGSIILGPKQPDTAIEESNYDSTL